MAALDAHHRVGSTRFRAPAPAPAPRQHAAHTAVAPATCSPLLSATVTLTTTASGTPGLNRQLLHDLSDIVIDILRLSHALHFDGDYSGTRTCPIALKATPTARGSRAAGE